MRDLVPAVQLDTRRLAADGRKRCPHGPDDQVSFTTPDLAGASAGHLHIEAGWMPATLRLDALEADVRTICEPYFTRPLSEIALGEVLFKLRRRPCRAS